MAVLKTGYSYYGTVPKINPYTLKQESFYSYCPKVIVSERSLSQSIAKGVNSRTFPIGCIKGSHGTGHKGSIRSNKYRWT